MKTDGEHHAPTGGGQPSADDSDSPDETGTAAPRGPSGQTLDLNCDAGEAFGPWPMGDDEALVPLMTSVNIACGAHAGDPIIMRRTVDLAIRHGVAIGAHPGYPDLQGFGRRAMSLTPNEVEVWMLAQIGALSSIARAAGARVQHVKPHGALYNAAADDPILASAIVRAIRDFDPHLILVARANSLQVTIGRDAGLVVAEEAFIDRRYDADGRLLPRSHPSALVTDPLVAGARAVDLIQRGGLAAADGTWIALRPITLCAHSDSAGAVAMVEKARAGLAAIGTRFRPMGDIAHQ